MLNTYTKLLKHTKQKLHVAKKKKEREKENYRVNTVNAILPYLHFYIRFWKISSHSNLIICCLTRFRYFLNPLMALTIFYDFKLTQTCFNLFLFNC